MGHVESVEASHLLSAYAPTALAYFGTIPDGPTRHQQRAVSGQPDWPAHGDRVVNVADEFQFSKAMNTYNPIFDSNGDGTVNLADEFQASRSFSSGGYGGDGFVTTI